MISPNQSVFKLAARGVSRNDEEAILLTAKGRSIFLSANRSNASAS